MEDASASLFAVSNASCKARSRVPGSALASAAISRPRAAELGAQTIWLGVWERNEKAQAFYRRFGFVECGEHVFTVGSDDQRDIIMSRSLTRAT